MFRKSKAIIKLQYQQTRINVIMLWAIGEDIGLQTTAKALIGILPMKQVI